MGKLPLIFLLLISLPSYAKLVPTQQLLSESSGVIFDGSMAGGDSIGGGDSPDTRKHTAWFYGNESIEVCYHVTQNFGIPSTIVGQTVGQVINEWKDYFTKNKIGDHLPSAQRINQSFILKNQCVGGEDIVLYFGTGPIFGNLRDLQARQALSRPVAYVNKTHISDDLFRSKGYIRFVEKDLYKFDGEYFPNWNRSNALYNMVKHEWGHLLGFGHKDGTVMRKDIAKVSFIDSTDPGPLKIDGSKKLHFCQSCDTIYDAPSNEIGINSVEYKRNGEIVINGTNASVVQPLHTKMAQEPLTLLSIFEYKSYQQTRPVYSMLSYQGQNYVLEFGEMSATLRKTDGSVLNLQRREL
ncbi:MAG: hypothetical protein HRT44_11435 [Bdellovibrionales bacterium]|nr:hypothetical protein [Bdellovibrionales bacterium]NQZ19854.1 hypothetical protein [Bdellovibrionales bacterium]